MFRRSIIKLRSELSGVGMTHAPPPIPSPNHFRLSSLYPCMDYTRSPGKIFRDSLLNKVQILLRVFDSA